MNGAVGMAGEIAHLADLLAHVEDPVALLASLPSVLAPKGRIVVHDVVGPQQQFACPLRVGVRQRAFAWIQQPPHWRAEDGIKGLFF